MLHFFAGMLLQLPGNVHPLGALWALLRFSHHPALVRAAIMN
jgi:hypothetical protein